ncbi:hypothetical protein D3C75_1127090 [compost metagenome]
MSQPASSIHHPELLQVLVISLQLFCQTLRASQAHGRQFHIDQQRGTRHRLHGIAVLQATVGEHQATQGLLRMGSLPRL